MSCQVQSVFLEIKTGIDFYLTLTALDSDGVAIDISDWTFDALLKDSAGVDFTTPTVEISDGPNGIFTYLILGSVTTGLPESRGTHGLKATRGDGISVPVMLGKYEIVPTVF